MDKKNLWLMGLAVFILVLLAYIVTNIAFSEGYPIYGHMYGGWMMPIGMLGMGLFWVFVIYLIMKTLVRNEDNHNQAIDLLKSRLAKGEISIEEYEILYKKVKGKSE